ncbi:UDP-N-acetylmuramoyl-L-alanyl-D-glutamate--2,6-diaminopimelate ligase [Candidatus Soleaferrea massiliensis]|uniref:UDP-N-acetylmuramoyl-L-alanyl-D-glutamate--2, 6-diaminopimelate ligase n=1 Tax=Candidatus Soleaferrea massiliensis TaxID=1470354 RepID=UPI00058E667B|nr:UDP-N-acetylmuramoyl-L-alanyl-D-glutamate--2,6-diaminopimelate ligase [Candidatus Soleaferrea massiliensis]
MGKFTITLSKLLEALKNYDLVVDYTIYQNFADINIDYISYNSKDIHPGSLFICKGFGFKEQYLKQALENGAIAYIAEQHYEDVPKDVPYIQVKDSRKAMSIIAIAYYDRPFEKINIVGITGTKGKTTTTYYVKNILDASRKRPTAIFSTVEMFTGKESEEAHLTTPESIDLQQHFDDILENGLDQLTMEVSSQAYKLSRVYGMDFDVGVFLNISEDHISPVEHEDFEDYLSCKIEFIKHCRTAIINGETREFDRVWKAAEENCQRVYTYGTNDSFDYYVENIRRQDGWMYFDICTKDYKKTFRTGMEGRFNAENALAAFAVAKVMGIDDASIARGLEITEVPGRMNVYRGQGKMVIVDYAHNYLSFSRLYESLKLDYPGQKIIAVFGCPGGKAYLRRRDIGTLSGENAQQIYLTAEDPQFEDVTEICEDIANYLKPYHVPYEIVPDRKTAIEKAIREALPGDILLIAGKGEETYQKVRGEYVPYESDVVIAKKCLHLL